MIWVNIVLVGLVVVILVEAVFEILIGVKNIMAVLDDLKTQVAASIAAEQAAIVVINNVAAQLVTLTQQVATLSQNAVDPADVAAIQASLKTSADALTAVVTANTPH